MLNITVHVQPDIAQALRRQQPSQAAEEIQAAMRDFNLTLEPLYPDDASADLAASFSVAVPNAAIGQQVVERLQACRGVEAAYLKPPDEMP